ncbi:hypothetical protein GMRT_11462 [Giardia muris]|uniref:Uncharacterized protein n=1 Tax=Giardia muris TaxID=5742 RepID=A0A4Z1SVD8_GIAMU|nr:hypothetical protein GMRT_11462 [Giardia muris]|eukprot:TNJ29766.1 hypothetical protein GMRT_11462 [Giardia muris]
MESETPQTFRGERAGERRIYYTLRTLEEMDRDEQLLERRDETTQPVDEYFQSLSEEALAVLEAYFVSDIPVNDFIALHRPRPEAAQWCPDRQISLMERRAVEKAEKAVKTYRWRTAREDRIPTSRVVARILLERDATPALMEQKRSVNKEDRCLSYAAFVEAVSQAMGLSTFAITEIFNLLCRGTPNKNHYLYDEIVSSFSNEQSPLRTTFPLDAACSIYAHCNIYWLDLLNFISARSSTAAVQRHGVRLEPVPTPSAFCHRLIIDTCTYVEGLDIYLTCSRDNLVQLWLPPHLNADLGQIRHLTRILTDDHFYGNEFGLNRGFFERLIKETHHQPLSLKPTETSRIRQAVDTILNLIKYLDKLSLYDLHAKDIGWLINMSNIDNSVASYLAAHGQPLPKDITTADEPVRNKLDFSLLRSLTNPDSDPTTLPLVDDIMLPRIIVEDQESRIESYKLSFSYSTVAAIRQSDNPLVSQRPKGPKINRTLNPEVLTHYGPSFVCEMRREEEASAEEARRFRERVALSQLNAKHTSFMGNPQLVKQIRMELADDQRQPPPALARGVSASTPMRATSGTQGRRSTSAKKILSASHGLGDRPPPPPPTLGVPSRSYRTHFDKREIDVDVHGIEHPLTKLKAEYIYDASQDAMSASSSERTRQILHMSNVTLMRQVRRNVLSASAVNSMREPNPLFARLERYKMMEEMDKSVSGELQKELRNKVPIHVASWASAALYDPNTDCLLLTCQRGSLRMYRVEKNFDLVRKIQVAETALNTLCRVSRVVSVLHVNELAEVLSLLFTRLPDNILNDILTRFHLNSIKSRLIAAYRSPQTIHTSEGFVVREDAFFSDPESLSKQSAFKWANERDVEEHQISGHDFFMTMCLPGYLSPKLVPRQGEAACTSELFVTTASDAIFFQLGADASVRPAAVVENVYGAPYTMKRVDPTNNLVLTMRNSVSLSPQKPSYECPRLQYRTLMDYDNFGANSRRVFHRLTVDKIYLAYNLELLLAYIRIKFSEIDRICATQNATLLEGYFRKCLRARNATTGASISAALSNELTRDEGTPIEEIVELISDQLLSAIEPLDSPDTHPHQNVWITCTKQWYSSHDKGDTLVSGFSNGDVVVWSLLTLRPKLILHAFPGSDITSLAFDSESNMLYVACITGAVRVFNYSVTSIPIAEFQEAASILRIFYSSYSDLLITVLVNGTVTIWSNTLYQQMTQISTHLVPTTAEWDEHNSLLLVCNRDIKVYRLVGAEISQETKRLEKARERQFQELHERKKAKSMLSEAQKSQEKEDEHDPMDDVPIIALEPSNNPESTLMQNSTLSNANTSGSAPNSKPGLLRPISLAGHNNMSIDVPIRLNSLPLQSTFVRRQRPGPRLDFLKPHGDRYGTHLRIGEIRNVGLDGRMEASGYNVHDPTNAYHPKDLDAGLLRAHWASIVGIVDLSYYKAAILNEADLLLLDLSRTSDSCILTFQTTRNAGPNAMFRSNDVSIVPPIPGVTTLAMNMQGGHQKAPIQRSEPPTVGGAGISSTPAPPGNDPEVVEEPITEPVPESTLTTDNFLATPVQAFTVSRAQRTRGYDFQLARVFSTVVDEVMNKHRRMVNVKTTFSASDGFGDTPLPQEDGEDDEKQERRTYYSQYRPLTTPQNTFYPPDFLLAAKLFARPYRVIPHPSVPPTHQYLLKSDAQLCKELLADMHRTRSRARMRLIRVMHATDLRNLDFSTYEARVQLEATVTKDQRQDTRSPGALNISPGISIAASLSLPPVPERQGEEGHSSPQDYNLPEYEAENSDEGSPPYKLAADLADPTPPARDIAFKRKVFNFSHPHKDEVTTEETSPIIECEEGSSSIPSSTTTPRPIDTAPAPPLTAEDLSLSTPPVDQNLHALLRAKTTMQRRSIKKLLQRSQLLSVQHGASVSRMRQSFNKLAAQQTLRLRTQTGVQRKTMTGIDILNNESIGMAKKLNFFSDILGGGKNVASPDASTPPSEPISPTTRETLVNNMSITLPNMSAEELENFVEKAEQERNVRYKTKFLTVDSQGCVCYWVIEQIFERIYDSAEFMVEQLDGSRPPSKSSESIKNRRKSVGNDLEASIKGSPGAGRAHSRMKRRVGLKIDTTVSVDSSVTSSEDVAIADGVIERRNKVLERAVFIAAAKIDIPEDAHIISVGYDQIRSAILCGLSTGEAVVYNIELSEITQNYMVANCAKTVECFYTADDPSESHRSTLDFGPVLSSDFHLTQYNESKIPFYLFSSGKFVLGFCDEHVEALSRKFVQEKLAEYGIRQSSDGLTRPPRTILTGHTGSVTLITSSRDYSSILTADDTGHIIYWQSTGLMKTRLRFESEQILALEFAAEEFVPGMAFLALGDGSIWIITPNCRYNLFSIGFPVENVGSNAIHFTSTVVNVKGSEAELPTRQLLLAICVNSLVIIFRMYANMRLVTMTRADGTPSTVIPPNAVALANSLTGSAPSGIQQHVSGSTMTPAVAMDIAVLSSLIIKPVTCFGPQCRCCTITAMRFTTNNLGLLITGTNGHAFYLPIKYDLTIFNTLFKYHKNARRYTFLGYQVLDRLVLEESNKKRSVLSAIALKNVDVKRRNEFTRRLFERLDKVDDEVDELFNYQTEECVKGLVRPLRQQVVRVSDALVRKRISDLYKLELVL